MRFLRLCAQGAVAFRVNVRHRPLHDPPIPCRAVQRRCGEPCLDHGVLTIGISQSILHEGQLSTRIKEVRGNRMLQAMELALLHQPSNKRFAK